MKVLNLKIDLQDLKLSEEEKKKNPVEISTSVIKNVIIGAAQASRGMSEEDRRLYYKLCDSFDKAIAENQEAVEIDDSWANFIKKGFKEAKLIPNDLLKKIEDLVAAIKDKE